MKREPLFKISYRLRKMRPAEQCEYLLACLALEGKDTVRSRELHKALVAARTAQMKGELPRKRA